MFLPILQWPSQSAWLVLRSSRDPQPLGQAIRRTLRQLDPGVPVEIESRYDEMATVLFGPRMATLALGVLGVMGAMLSITGIFGTAAYSVSKRLRELGIRVALGAQRKEVLQAALGRAFKIAGNPRAGERRVSGDAARSSGFGRSCCDNVAGGAIGCIDSCASRGVGCPKDRRFVPV